MTIQILSNDEEIPEVAFYYPGPVWDSGDWIKNLILFFDGIALLVPDYIKNKPFTSDPSIATELDKHGLLHILDPKTLIDREATTKLAELMTDVITSGELNALANDGAPFEQISLSRLGESGDRDLALMILEELKSRGLAKDSEDGNSIPIHPTVRTLILVLLSQILKPQGKSIGLELSPVTERENLFGSLEKLLALHNARNSSGRQVVAFDLKDVGVDLSIFPIDEILDFRKENFRLYRRYALSVKDFVTELNALSDEQIKDKYEKRHLEIGEIAEELKRISSKAWRNRATFAFGLAGIAYSAYSGSTETILTGIAALLAAYNPPEVKTNDYSYIIKANQKFRRKFIF